MARLIHALSIFLGACSLACSSPTGPGATHLGETYETFQGYRSAPAELRHGGKRLDIFLGVLNDEAETREYKEILYCIAQNDDKRPLPEAVERINASPEEKTIYIYGQRIVGKHEIWWDGLDCVAQAIAVWHNERAGYVYYDLNYSDPITLKDAFPLLRKAVKKGVDKGVDTVVP